jgi:hypothetical protein
MTDHKYPPGYGRYIFAHSKDDSPEHKAIIKFAARYRFAGQFEAVQVHGYSDKTTEIYSETLRISLAYSAFEQLLKVKGLSGISSVKIPAAANTFRSAQLEKLRSRVLRADSKKLVEQIQELIDSKSSTDMLPVIKSIRHGMFHGALTPGSVGSSKTVFTFLEDLSRGLFVEMDRLFDVHLTRLQKEKKRD